MEDALFIANGAALGSIVYYCPCQCGVFAQHLRGAFDGRASEQVHHNQRGLLNCTHFVERAIHKGFGGAGSHDWRVGAEGILGLAVVRRYGDAGLVRGEAELPQRVDHAPISMRDAEVQTVVAVRAPGVVCASPGDGCGQILVQGGVEGEVGRVAAPTAGELKVGMVTPALEQSRVLEDLRVYCFPPP